MIFLMLFLLVIWFYVSKSAVIFFPTMYYSVRVFTHMFVFTHWPDKKTQVKWHLIRPLFKPKRKEVTMKNRKSTINRKNPKNENYF